MNNNKKYKIITKLKDNTEIISYSDFTWKVEDDLNDIRIKFISIGGNIIRKDAINSIIFEKNEKYIESEKEN